MFHFRLSAYSKQGGVCIVAKAAYNAGLALRRWEDWQLQDFAFRRDVVHHEVSHAFGDDSEELWNRLLYEYRDDPRALLAREVVHSLPWQLSLEGKIRLAQAQAEYLVQRWAVAVDMSIQGPPPIPGASALNWHVHHFFTRDQVTPRGFRRVVSPLDRNPQGRGRALQAAGPAEVRILRMEFARMDNAALEREGFAERVDHRSYVDQGIDRIPTRPLGRKLTKKERRGDATHVGDENRLILKVNQVAEHLGISAHKLLEGSLTYDTASAEYQTFQSVVLHAATKVAEYELAAKLGVPLPPDAPVVTALYHEFLTLMQQQVGPEFMERVKRQVALQGHERDRAPGHDLGS